MVNTSRGLVKQREVFAPPPIIDKLDVKFNIKGKPVIFSWGDVIYNPEHVEISKALANHESTHGTAQLMFPTIEEWWERYIEDPHFRLAEEVFAHAVEYATIKHDGQQNRKQRRKALVFISKRLASPLYNNMVSLKEAKRLILNELQEASPA